MPHYVDGFVIPILKQKLPGYRKIAKEASKVWMEHGALQYVEAIAEDVDADMGLSFPKLCKLKRGETVVFSWILYKSRLHRDRVNKKVMADPRMKKMIEQMTSKKPVFDMQRFSYGGFEAIVEA